MNKKIIMLAGAKSSTNIIYNALKKDFNIEKVIIEEPVSRSVFIKKRIKKLGLLIVFGQILFKLIVVPLLKLSSKKRISELKHLYNLDETAIDQDNILKVSSVNSDQTMQALKQYNPDLVLVEGTRIISGKIIDCVPSRFVNMHVGINPLYRGVHGAYWALIQNDRNNCGVTVHYVDTGIDTGSILEQGVIDPGSDDNFLTYSIHQFAAGIPLLKKALTEVIENRAEIKPNPSGESKLWTHPTIWQYLWYELKLGVK